MEVRMLSVERILLQGMLALSLLLLYTYGTVSTDSFL